MRCLCDLHPGLRRTATVTLGLALAACSEGVLDLQELSDQDALTSRITLDEFEQTLDQTTRVEIKLLPDALVAREVELETEADEINDEEEIESRIVALAADATEGTLTLLLGDLVVGFTDQTRFRRDGGDDMTFAAFVARVSDELASNRQPPVRAERPAGAEPQSPDDATFIATEIRLEDDEDGEPEIEINIDADNLVMNDAPPPDAWINVLGLAIELRLGDGTTELEGDGDDDDNGPNDEPDDDDQDEFEAIVTSVDVDANTFTLEDGTLVRIDPDQTKIDGEGDLTTLTDVKAAVEAGSLVRAEGDAVAESAGPPIQLLALNVKFEVDDENEGEDEQRVGEEDFEDTIASLTVDEISTIVLDNGTVVLIDGNTEIKQSGDDKSLNSLQEVMDALNAGRAVETEGKGTVQGVEPLTILADEIEFESEAENEEEEEQEPIGTEENFEDTVASLVIADVSTVTLTNGTVVLIDENTEIKQSGGETSLNSLQEVLGALNAGRTVETKGKGLVQGVEPQTILADEIEFETAEDGS